MHELPELAPPRLTQQLQFLVELEKLKSIWRRSFVIGADRVENAAEHSWHLALMALVLAEHAAEPVDAARVMKLVLLHDIVEIDAGDTYAYDAVGQADQAEREAAAADRLFGLLPPDQAQEFRALWDEFEARATPEARFAHALDRLMPLFQAYLTQGRSWRMGGIRPQQVAQRIAPIADGSPALFRVAQALLEAAEAQGFFSSSAPVHPEEPASTL